MYDKSDLLWQHGAGATSDLGRAAGRASPARCGGGGNGRCRWRPGTSSSQAIARGKTAKHQRGGVRIVRADGPVDRLVEGKRRRPRGPHSDDIPRQVAAPPSTSARAGPSSHSSSAMGRDERPPQLRGRAGGVREQGQRHHVLEELELRLGGRGPQRGWRCAPVRQPRGEQEGGHIHPRGSRVRAWRSFREQPPQVPWREAEHGGAILEPGQRDPARGRGGDHRHALSFERLKMQPPRPSDSLVPRVAVDAVALRHQAGGRHSMNSGSSMSSEASPVLGGSSAIPHPVARVPSGWPLAQQRSAGGRPSDGERVPTFGGVRSAAHSARGGGHVQ
jgi:hypothetical protein